MGDNYNNEDTTIIPEHVKKKFQDDIDIEIKENKKRKKELTKENKNLGKIKEIFEKSDE